MLVSDSKKFLFIHIPKTGGKSLRTCFRGIIPDVEEGIGGRIHHAGLSDVLKMDLSCRYREYYTAAFVRNPWDRLVSFYAYFTTENMGNPQGLIRQRVLRRARSFEEFVLYCPTVEGRYGRKPLSVNQIDYLTDISGDLAVDFIGRFENFEESAATLLRFLGLPDVRIPHVNRTRHDGYRSYYTNETREIVRRRFRRDIDEFGYTF